MILAGDIGGTSTRLAIFDVRGTKVVPIDITVFKSRDFPSLNAVVQTYRSAHGHPIDAACFGIAGPVVRNRSAPPNLPWIVDGAELATLLGQASVGLLNDLEANAYGVGGLEPEDFAVLNQGTPDPHGNAAIISAGTGLGEAGFHWDGNRHHPFASEGGHADFAPRDELEWALLMHLRKRFDRVSYERVLSGPGLFNIYEFLREQASAGGASDCQPAWLTDAIEAHGGPAAVSKAGLEGTSELCVRALHLFASFYGAEAGNLALKMMATGGLYVGGGIAPKILPKLLDGTFMTAFTAKGRMRALMEAIPVRVIRNDKTALIGAARWCMLQALDRRSTV